MEQLADTSKETEAEWRERLAAKKLNAKIKRTAGPAEKRFGKDGIEPK